MSLPSASGLDKLGIAVGYPSNGYRSTLAECERELEDLHPEAACALGAYRRAIAGLDEWEIQELSVLFELATQLEVGRERCVLGRFGRTVQDHDQQRSIMRVAQQLDQQLSAVRVGPLEVVDD